METARLIIGDKTIELPVITGSEGEKAIDITELRKKTGYITLDPGLGNSGSCKSTITFVDGEKGILRYRGIPVEQLAEKSTFVETAYLLTHGHLPSHKQLTNFSIMLNDNSLVHEDMRTFFEAFPRGSHPMGILSSMVNALRGFYPEIRIGSEEEFNKTVARIISKVRTMAAMSYRISKGYKVVYPRPDLDYCSNFLNMMFDNPVNSYEIEREKIKNEHDEKKYQQNRLKARALNVFWILHADHEQNCSTSTVRMVGSGRVNIYAAISAGIAALWGPLHGGANQAVIEMLKKIQDSGGDIIPFVKRAKDKDDPFRLMGFGHRVYKSYDPRAKIMKNICHSLLNELDKKDPLLDIAMKLEEVALSDEYFIKNNFYPNVDFYSGIALRALGIPTDMFPVMFAIGRLPGWIAQWKEDADDPNWKLYRPRQIYIGEEKRDYIPKDAR